MQNEEDDIADIASGLGLPVEELMHAMGQTRLSETQGRRPSATTGRRSSATTDVRPSSAVAPGKANPRRPSATAPVAKPAPLAFRVDSGSRGKLDRPVVTQLHAENALPATPARRATVAGNSARTSLKPNLKQPSVSEEAKNVCPCCNQGIDSLYVSAAGTEWPRWHQDCFKCAVDNCGRRPGPETNIHVRGTTLYCEEHFGTLFAPKCPGCSLPVVSGTITRALDATWHRACFKCAVCTARISGGFTLREDRPVCDSCASGKGAAAPAPASGSSATPVKLADLAAGTPTSGSARGGVRVRSATVSDTYSLPSPAQRPAGLGRDLGCGRSSASAVTLAPRPVAADEAPCSACMLPIEGKFVAAQGREWHTSCFTCSAVGCARPLAHGVPYKLHDGSLFCEEHFGALFAPKCPGCSLPVVSGTITRALDATWHRACFKCAVCTACISGGFFARDGNPICDACQNTL